MWTGLSCSKDISSHCTADSGSLVNFAFIPTKGWKMNVSGGIKTVWATSKRSCVSLLPSVHSSMETLRATEPHSRTAGPLNTALFTLKQASRLILWAHSAVTVVNVWSEKQKWLEKQLGKKLCCHLVFDLAFISLCIVLVHDFSFLFFHYVAVSFFDYDGFFVFFNAASMWLPPLICCWINKPNS